jgi:hypothetical protein
MKRPGKGSAPTQPAAGRERLSQQGATPAGLRILAVLPMQVTARQLREPRRAAGRGSGYARHRTSALPELRLANLGYFSLQWLERKDFV